MNWELIFDLESTGYELPKFPLNSAYWNSTFLFNEENFETTWHPLFQWKDNRCRSIFPGMADNKLYKPKLFYIIIIQNEDDSEGCYVLRDEIVFKSCDLILHNRIKCPGIEWKYCDMIELENFETVNCTDRQILPPELDRSGNAS